MDDEAAAVMAPLLAPGETLLWSGRPAPGLYAWNNGAGLIVVGLMVASGAFVFSWWAVVLVLAGALGVGLALRRKAETVRYGLTDRRAIIAWSWPRAGNRWIPVDRFNICLMDGNNDNRDPTTILFRKGLSDQWWGRPFEIDAFIGVKPSKDVANLVQGFVGHRR